MAMHPGHPIVTPYLRISTSRLMQTRLALGPAGSPTGGGKTCSGGTSGAGRRIRAAGSARRRSQGSPLTARSNSTSHASISGSILIARAGCTPSGVPMAQSLAPTPQPRIPRKMPTYHQLSALMRLTMFLGTRPPNLLSPWSHWSAKLAPYAQIIRRLPVEPWPKPRYQPCQAVMRLRDSPTKTHLCAVPLSTNFRLELFDCTFQ